MWKGFFSVPTWKEIPITLLDGENIEHMVAIFVVIFTLQTAKPLFHFYTCWNMRCSCFFLWIESIHHFCRLIRDDSSHSNLLPRHKKSSEFWKPIAFFFPALFLQNNIKRSCSFYVFFSWLQAAFITVLFNLHTKNKRIFHDVSWLQMVVITFLNQKKHLFHAEK